jgi:exocyst complex component 4
MLTRLISQFDMVISKYQHLSTTVHRALYLSLRLTILASLNETIKPSYVLENSLSDPDPSLQALTAKLTSYDTEVFSYIPTLQHTHITTGLSTLTDTYLLRLITKRVKDMNPNGCAHLQLNMLVLQQNLKNIEPATSLTFSAMFLDLYTAGPDAIVRWAKESGRSFKVPGGSFGEAEVRTLLELAYGDKLKDERREVGVQAKRLLDGHLLDISEAFY